jgi:hypothetical protein
MVKNRHGLFLFVQPTIDPAAVAVAAWMNLRRVIRLKLRMIFSRITQPLWIVDCRLSIADSRLAIGDCRLQI